MSLINSEKMVRVQLAALQFLQKLAESTLGSGAGGGDCAWGGSETTAGGGEGGVFEAGPCGGDGMDR